MANAYSNYTKTMTKGHSVKGWKVKFIGSGNSYSLTI